MLEIQNADLITEKNKVSWAAAIFCFPEAKNMPRK